MGEHGLRTLGLSRFGAITDPDNQASARVLEAVGPHLERLLPSSATTRLLLLVRDPCLSMTAQHAMRKRRNGPGLPR